MIVNPLSVAQQLIAGIICVALLVAGYMVYGLFSDRSELEGIHKADATVAKGNEKFDTDSKKRSAQSATYFTAVKQQAAAIPATGDFDAAARGVYFRVLNDALRGAKR